MIASMHQLAGFAHLMPTERIEQISGILTGCFDDLDEMETLAYHLKNELRVAMRAMKSLKRQLE